MRSHRLFSRPRQRHGGVSALTVLCLALLVGVTAVAVDGGRLMENRRHVQAAADAAALAAAADLFTNYGTNQGIDPSGTALASALAIAAANGFNNDGVQSIVTVSISPQNYQSGPNAGKALPPGYVEVIIQYNAGRTFSNVFGSGAVPVRGRAVARGQWLPASNQVMALKTRSTGVAISGSASVSVNGGLLVNSNSSSAITVSLGASLSALSMALNSGGGIVGSLLGLLGLPPPITSGPPVADPLRSLPPPDPVALGLSVQGTNLTINGGSADLYPGIYNGGITIGQGASVTLHPNSNGTPGIYFLQGGGLTVTGSSNVAMLAGSTAGVTIYNDWQTSTDAINLSGSGSLVLTPPSSGIYQGLTIFQKRGTRASPAPALTIVGSGSTSISGTLYAAYANVTLTNSSGSNLLGGQIIADTVNANGNGTINVDSSGGSVANTRIYGLVE
jgi:Flp pilus assembly protein TadG